MLFNLEILNCDDNNITSLKGVEKLTKLKYCNCNRNKLQVDSKFIIQMIQNNKQFE